MVPSLESKKVIPGYKEKKKQITFHCSASTLREESDFSIRVRSDCKALTCQQGDAFCFTELQVSPRHFLGIPLEQKRRKQFGNDCCYSSHWTFVTCFFPAHCQWWLLGARRGSIQDTKPAVGRSHSLCFVLASVQKIVVKEVTPMAISAVSCSRCFQLRWNISQRIQVLEIRNSIKNINVFLGRVV